MGQFDRSLEETLIDTQHKFIEELESLAKQSITESSHFYTANILRKAISELRRLYEIEWMYRGLTK